jgi:3-deoxy-D-manno-octulosonic-acid transferase
MHPMILVNLYNLISIILFPLYIVLLIYRLILRKETISSIGERLAITSKVRKSGKLIWLHAASVGESAVAVTLIQAIAKAYPQVNFLVTTGTLSAANILEKSLPSNADHQPTPIDNIIVVRKFLSHWQPDLGIFIESEIWPCLISQSAKTCKLMLVNGRLSDKSFNAWMRRKSLFNFIIQHFSKILLQSEKDLSKYIALGYDKAINLGNIKFSNKELPVNEDELKALKKLIGDKKIFVAASTHKEDEEVVLKMIQNLKKEKVDYYPIIILRHPERREEVSEHCRKLNLSFSLRSKVSKPNMQEDLYIGDTFKELGLFYSIATIVFVGGSFKQGGHNLLEPAQFNNAIILGPDMSNFQNIADEVLDRGAAVQINNVHELEEQVKLLLVNSDDLLQKMSQNAKQYVDENKGALEKYMSEIEKFIG